MDFVAAVVAIVAIILVLRMRGRVTALEQHVDAAQSAASRCVTRRREAAPEPPAPAAAAAGRTGFAARGFRQARRDRARRGTHGRGRDRAGRRQRRRRPPPPPEPAEPAKSFEERFGASWVVWIGGLALALGGIFLVQYSIEAGLIGPGVRVFLGGLLAAGLIAAGEWTRRREFSIGLDNVPTAHIPSILTAAGTTVAFATDLRGLRALRIPRARHRLRAARHRGARDARGRAAARAGARRARAGRRVRRADADRDRRSRTTGRSTSISRSSPPPRSRSRARGCGAGSPSRRSCSACCGRSPASSTTRFDCRPPVALYLVVGFALAAALLVSGLLYGPDAEAGRIDPVSSGALAAYLARRRRSGARARP